MEYKAFGGGGVHETFAGDFTDYLRLKNVKNDILVNPTVMEIDRGIMANLYKLCNCTVAKYYITRISNYST